MASSFNNKKTSIDYGLGHANGVIMPRMILESFQFLGVAVRFKAIRAGAGVCALALTVLAFTWVTSGKVLASPVTMSAAEYLELNREALEGTSLAAKDRFEDLHRTGFKLTCTTDDEWEFGGTGLEDCASALFTIKKAYSSKVPDVLAGTRGGEPIEEGGTGMGIPSWFYAAAVALVIAGWLIVSLPSLRVTTPVKALVNPQNAYGSLAGAAFAFVMLGILVASGVMNDHETWKSYYKKEILATDAVADANTTFSQDGLVLNIPPLIN